jgi:spoIIIJ-associated protein
MQKDVETILQELLSSIGAKYGRITRTTLAGQEILSIEAAEDPQALIGPRGDTIHAIDHIVKKITEKHSAGEEEAQSQLVLIDVGDYRARQIKDLQAKALIMAERARSFQYDVELAPMSAYERLIIHTTLSDAPNVKTESQGEGRGRRVVIKYSAE